MKKCMLHKYEVPLRMMRDGEDLRTGRNKRSWRKRGRREERNKKKNY